MPHANHSHRILIPLSLLCVVLFAGCPTFPVLQVSVPDLDGLTREVAEDAVAQAGLSVGNVWITPGPAEHDGVFEQWPEAGRRVAVGTPVDFLVAFPSDGVPMPDLRGLKRSEAQALLSESSMSVRMSGQYSTVIKQDRVISQAPEPGTTVNLYTDICIFVSLGPETTTAIEGYELAAVWPSDDIWDMTNPVDFALSPTNTVYVLESSYRVTTIKEFDRDGTLLHSWPYDTQCNGLAVDSAGSVFLTTSDNYVVKYSPDGLLLTFWGGHGVGPGQFVHPTRITVDSSGNVFVVDRNNHRIQKFSPEGEFLLTLGSPGSGEGEFQYPDGVTVGDSGLIYVIDDRAILQVFTPEGEFLEQFDLSYRLYSGGYTLDVDRLGNIHVLDAGGDSLVTYTPTASFIDSQSLPGNGGYESIVKGGNDGNLYVLSSQEDAIFVLSASGSEIIDTWAVHSSQDGRFWMPSGITVDSHDNVYVADYGNERIQVLSPDGVCLKHIDTLSEPADVALGSGDSMFVVMPDIIAIAEYYSTGEMATSWAYESAWYAGRASIACDGNATVFLAKDDGISLYSPGGMKFDMWEQYTTPFIAVYGADTCYTVARYDDSVLKLSSSGKKLAEWGADGYHSVLQNLPWWSEKSTYWYTILAISVDAEGFVYVAASSDGEYIIQKFTSNGVLVLTSAMPEVQCSSAFPSTDMCIDSAQNIYLTSPITHKVYKYAPVYDAESDN